MNTADLDSLKKFLTSTDGDYNLPTIIDTMVGICQGNASSIAKFISFLKSSTSILDIYNTRKFIRFLVGVTEIENTEKVTLSEKLFSSDENSKENALRILGYINKTESEKIIEFMINATRSLLLDLINRDTYFRIVRVLSNSMYEDLIFLKDNMSKQTIECNSSVLALMNNGLMIQAGIDANKSVEQQEYSFTKLGKDVDQFALSLNDEKRMKEHNDGEFKSPNYNTGIEVLSENDIDDMFQDFK